MPLTLDEINLVIEKVQKQLSSYNSALELICITHRTGGRKQACLNLAKGYREDKISPSLDRLLSTWIKNPDKDDVSEFLGTIETHRGSFANLIKSKVFVNIIALNINNYRSEMELETDLFRLSWNACNILKNAPKTDSKNLENRILIPKSQGFKKLSNNLQADIFASLVCSLTNKIDYIHQIGAYRANAVLKAKSLHTPAEYPFIIALDQTKYMYQQLLNKRKLNANLIEQVWTASKIILQSMNQQKLQTWNTFAKNSQDMAWRGFSKNIILSIAIDGNDDIETKKLGVQIASLLNIEPASNEEGDGYYNPYKSDSGNAQEHNSLVEELFENLLTRSIFENSSTPLIEKANEQNAKLRKGQFMGWCASALQEAADVFDKSIKANQPPTQTTREIFKTHFERIKWEKLKALGEDILSLRQNKNDLKEREFIDFLEKDYNNQIFTTSVLRSARKNKLNSQNPESMKLNRDVVQEDDEIYGPERESIARHTSVTRH